MSSWMLFLAFFLPVTAGTAQTPAASSTERLRDPFIEVARAVGHVEDDIRWRGIETKLARREVEVVSRALLATRP